MNHTRVTWTAALVALLWPLSAQAAWYAGPQLQVERSEHTATLLATGEALLCGGTGAMAQVLASCELVSPDRGTSRPAASMPVPAGVTSTGGRYRHTAVLLTTGEVLVVGGIALVNGAPATVGWAALYTPASDSWRTVASLATDRASATATRLTDGRVAIIGGVRIVAPSGALVGAVEYFDPATGRFTAGPTLATPRFQHTATRLADGRVLVVGGRILNGDPVAALERLDPATGTVTPLPMGPWNASILPVATLLASGQVFLDGEPNVAQRFDPVGGTWTTLPVGTLEVEEMATVLFGDGRVLELAGARATLYDPLLNQWTPSSAGLGDVGRAFTATRLASGQVLVAGGTGTGVATRSTRVFDPETRAVVDPGVPLLSAPRAGHTASLLPDGQVLLWGGVEPQAASNRPAAELFDPASRTLTALPSITTYRRAHASVDLAGGKVLVAGGVECTFTCSGSVLASVELYDPARGQARALPPMAQPRSRHTLTRLVSGEILAVGGAAPVQAELFDPATLSWSAAGAMSSRRVGHTASLLEDGTVLVVGGQDGAIRHATVEQYTPATRGWRARAALVEGRESHAAVVLGDGRVMVTGGVVGPNAALARATASVVIYDPVANSWTFVADMRAARADHAATLLADGRVLVVGGAVGQARAEVWSPMTGAWVEVLDNVTAPQLRFGGIEVVTLVTGEQLATGGDSLTPSEFMTYFRLGAASRPSLVRPAMPLASGAAATLTGAGLVPVSEGHFGRTEASASDVAVVRVLALGEAPSLRLPARAFSPTRLTVTTPAGSLGHRLLLDALGGAAGGQIVRFGNTAPSAVALTRTTPEDTPVDLVLAGGDRDGDDVTFSLTGAPTRGRFFGTPPVLTYQPNADANGREQVQVSVSDGLTTSTALLTIDIQPVNDAPRASSDVFTLDEDTRLVTTASTGVLANDVDVDSAALTVQVDATGLVGTLVVGASDGRVDFTPPPDWSGTTRFRYDVFDGALASTQVEAIITVRPVPDAPVALPDRLEATEDRVTSFDVTRGVLANDRDADGDRLRAVLVRTSTRARVVLDPDGSLTYEPAADFVGEDRFVYVASDGTATSAETEVVVVVADVNDAPSARDDAYAVQPGRALVLTATAGVLSNDLDVDGDRLEAAVVVPPLHGTLALGRDGSLRFTPEGGYAGMDTFEYVATDGRGGEGRARVTLAIAVDVPMGTPDRYVADEDVALVVDAPRGLLANDRTPQLVAALVTPPARGVVQLEPDGSFVYQGERDTSGTDTFTYRVSRGSAVSEPIAVTIEVRPIDDAPEPPELRLPIDQATLADGRVVFTWAAARDVDDARLSYRVSVEAAGREVLALGTQETSIDVAPDQALAPGVYTWTVEASDPDNLKSGPSSARTFTVGAAGGAPPSEGCGCATTPESGAAGQPWLVLAVVALGLWRARRRFAPTLLTAALTVGLLACSSTPDVDGGTDAAVCAPRETRACTCSDGRAGTQVCAAWGDYAACACGAAADGGDAAADVAPAEDARVDAATDTGVGADADAGLPPDTGARDAEPEDARADVGPADTGPVDSGVHTWCTSFPQGFVAPPVPGAFAMGSPVTEVGGQANERTRQPIEFQSPFWISATEVTQAEWDRLMPTNPSRVPCPDCPVEGVSWDQAVDYVNALSASCGLPACFPATPADRRTAVLDLACTGFRLPTEAEWEYSARGGTQTAFWSGEATQEFGVEPALDGVAWYLASSGAAVRAAGILRANAYGLYDVHGNVAEWVADGLRTYGPGNLIDPVSHPMSAYTFVLRGGHAGDAPRDCRAASRRSDATGAARVLAGLRVARRR